MPGQNGDHEDNGRSRDFQGHRIECRSNVKRFGNEGENVRRFLFSRGWFSDFNGSWKCRWLEALDRADYNRVVQFSRAAIGCCAVQRSYFVLLSWTKDVLGKAAEIPEGPYEKESVPAHRGSVDHALIGIECDDNPL